MKPIEETLQYIRDNSAAYAKAKAECEYLNHYRKSKIAILMADAEQMGIKSAVQQEAFARRHPEYLQVLEGYKVAIEEAEKFRLMIKAAETRIDVWRTQQASKRKEMEAYQS